MKVISQRVLKNGQRRVTVGLDPQEKLLAVQPGRYFKLGYPVDDIVASHVIEDAHEARWCSAQQEWVL